MVNATDPDQGTGGSVLFSFQPPSPFFAIDGARGTVTVIRPLDYETTSAYQLTVNATVSTQTREAFWLYISKDNWIHVHILNFCFYFYQDQDKLRPLSRLANLAISITDVQDMDPIFTNLPYSTNIEEDIPLVSDTVPPGITLLVSYSCSFYVKSCDLSISFPPILLCCQHVPLIFHSIAHPQLLLSQVHPPLWLFRRCLEQVQEKYGSKSELLSGQDDSPLIFTPEPPPPPPKNPHGPKLSPWGPYIQHCRCLRL